MTFCRKKQQLNIHIEFPERSWHHNFICSNATFFCQNAKSWTAAAGKTCHPEMLFPENCDVIKWTLAAGRGYYSTLPNLPGHVYVHCNTAKLQSKPNATLRSHPLLCTRSDLKQVFIMLFKTTIYITLYDRHHCHASTLITLIISTRLHTRLSRHQCIRDACM